MTAEPRFAWSDVECCLCRKPADGAEGGDAVHLTVTRPGCEDVQQLFAHHGCLSQAAPVFEAELFEF